MTRRFQESELAKVWLSDNFDVLKITDWLRHPDLIKVEDHSYITIDIYGAEVDGPAFSKIDIEPCWLASFIIKNGEGTTTHHCIVEIIQVITGIQMWVTVHGS